MPLTAGRSELERSFRGKNEDRFVEDRFRIGVFRDGRIVLDINYRLDRN